MESFVSEYWPHLIGFPVLWILYMSVTLALSIWVGKRYEDYLNRFTAGAVGLNWDDYVERFHKNNRGELTDDQWLVLEEDNLKMTNHMVKVVTDNTLLMRLNTGMGVIGSFLQWTRLIILAIGYCALLYLWFYGEPLLLLWGVFAFQVFSWFICWFWGVATKWITGYVGGTRKNLQAVLNVQHKAAEQVDLVRMRIADNQSTEPLTHDLDEPEEYSIEEARLEAFETALAETDLFAYELGKGLVPDGNSEHNPGYGPMDFDEWREWKLREFERTGNIWYNHPGGLPPKKADT